jgi:hypothetical protein
MRREQQGRGKGKGGCKPHTNPSRRRGGGRGRLGAPKSGLFRDIALAPDRERVPEARPVVSFHADDAEEFLTEVERRSLGRYALSRRGVDHGQVAELRPDGLVPPRPRRRRREVIESERWVAARPILLPGAAERARVALVSEDVDGLHARLEERGGLRAFLDRCAGRLAPGFRVLAQEPTLADPERDLERVLVASERGPEDLWLKTGRLSTHPEDRSLRLRVSFGEEGDDDASRDDERQALVGELARCVLPGARALDGLDELRAALERHVGGPVLGTQHIAYWNAPGGGARFHHDAFAEPAEGGQRGVVFAQLTGRTVWLALSIEELAARVRELVRWLEDGDLPWLREELANGWDALVEVARSRTPCLAELGRPGCGLLGPLVDAPAFTSYLTDAGHALVLHPGDVLLLPNHGLERTAMHSVFAASERPGYALSVAVRVAQSSRSSETPSA